MSEEAVNSIAASTLIVAIRNSYCRAPKIPLIEQHHKIYRKLYVEYL